MAKYRQVHVHIWKDGWFLDLEPMYKLFFIYLFTNERASISGIYELSRRVMAFESGLTFSEIDGALQAFDTEGKAYYDDGVVWVPNLRKYHESKSPKVVTFIEEDVGRLKNCKLKSIYVDKYHMDTVSIGYTDSIHTVSSSSSIGLVSDSSGNRDKPESEPAPKLPIGTHYELSPDEVPHYQHNERRRLMVAALVKVTKTTITVSHGLDSAEQAVDAWHEQHGDGPDEVLGFADFWRIPGDGKYSGRPALKSMLNQYGDYVDWRKTKSKVSAGGVNDDGSVGRKLDWSAI